MRDGIINETGNSRYLRTVAGIKQLAPTYDAFLELLVKGELPIDLNGINADGWAQVGTALNKANLLTDATAALIDLGSEATPNEMLAALANKLKAAESKEDVEALKKTVSSLQSDLNTLKNTTVPNLQKTVQTLQQKLDSLITAGTVDLTAGSSPLETGKVYLVYE